MGYLMRIVLAAIIVFASMGCTPVKPWEREYLAKEHMAFDPDPLEARFSRRVYQAKEGARGGYGIEGGGCGCN